MSSNNDQSATSSFCNANASQLNSMGYGSACGSNNVDQVAIFRAAPESKNEDSFFNHSGNNRSIQREAALNKFRLKRKDRCYEKKVHASLSFSYLLLWLHFLPLLLQNRPIVLTNEIFVTQVRYESRKKLAEQRPRIKGQFVRQVLNDPSPTEIDGNAYDDLSRGFS